MTEEQQSAQIETREEKPRKQIENTGPYPDEIVYACENCECEELDHR